MDLILTRQLHSKDGIFGCLTDGKGNVLAVTAEHAYEQEDGTFEPKVKKGIHRCFRSIHDLDGDGKKFITFQVGDNELPTAGILFHVGNYAQVDSDGCILLGKQFGFMMNGGRMICDSKAAFDAFIKVQQYIDEFILTID